MQTNPQVSEWFAGDRDYTTGLAIFLQHSRSGSLKKLLSRGENPKNRKKLEYELGKLAPKAPPKKKVKAKKTPREVFHQPARRAGQKARQLSELLNTKGDGKTPISVSELVDYPDDQLPPAIAALKHRRISLHRKMTALQNELGDLKTNGERLHHAQRITEYGDGRDKIWRQMDHWAQTGELPPDEHEELSKKNVVELMKLRQNLRTYKSKAKNRLAKLEEGFKALKGLKKQQRRTQEVRLQRKQGQTMETDRKNDERLLKVEQLLKERHGWQF